MTPVLTLLLRLSGAIDALNARVGRAASSLVLVAVLISAGNALIRYVFDASSNAWLEVQWYLFSAVFLLCAGYTLLQGEHIRIDIVFDRLPPRTRAWVDIAGTVVFLLPVSLLLMVLSWPGLVESIVRGEVSGDAGGLVRWPARMLMPVGFLLLSLQGASEIIKRAAFLKGRIADPSGTRTAPLPAGDRD